MKKKEHWNRARELAKFGYTVTEASRILKLHHSTLLYIAGKMDFKWPSNGKGKYVRYPQETVGRVERMMRLACK